MRKTIQFDAGQLEAILETQEFPQDAIQRILERVADVVEPPRLHSSMTVHEAQDWLAANDPAGSLYWRAEPLTVDLIATVGEQIQAVGGTSRWIFDADWQKRYARGEID